MSKSNRKRELEKKSSLFYAKNVKNKEKTNKIWKFCWNKSILKT
ncbi:hypothetical protein RUMGNA_01107 [Mediterraneibacter gnavus ATCC 29149]|uniref:Uncharacterized protein n=1 Tax=Mediterraneibacter gnavus (strain ATCC 29149 / DSM 114966 / JCM 6515 / VPI C7-9) TaxID=411470 RepID=A7B0N1_MEDG7|nr:hypothetical protein RUMGNA_01107 [Mediterraneibacter gnavus ATCC 29149]